MSGPKNALADKGPADAPVPMPDGKLDLPDGKHALLQTRPTHAEYKRAFKAMVGVLEGKDEDKLEVMTDLVEVFLVEWDVVDRDGAVLGRDRAAIERCPQDVMTLVFNRASEIFKAIKVPKT
jgi:hypothetical protein